MIRHDVMALEPDTSAATQFLARCYEAKLTDIHASRAQWPPQWSTYNCTTPGPFTPSQLSSATTLQTNTTHSYPTFANQPQCTHNKRPSYILYPLDQRDHRARGLCFNCDEAYNSTHICKKSVMTILECLTSPPPEDNSKYHECPPMLDDPLPNPAPL